MWALSLDQGFSPFFSNSTPHFKIGITLLSNFLPSLYLHYETMLLIELQKWPSQHERPESAATARPSVRRRLGDEDLGKLRRTDSMLRLSPSRKKENGIYTLGIFVWSVLYFSWKHYQFIRWVWFFQIFLCCILLFKDRK